MASQNVAFAFMAGAAVVAIGATYGVYRLVQSYDQLAQPEDDLENRATIAVVAASRTLYQGVEISNDDLFVVSVPPEYLPRITKDASTGEELKAEVFRTRERVVGQVPRERILKNEFIRPERLADGNLGIGMNAVVARGMRAISLDMRGGDAVSGFLAPGNYVDVLVTMEDEEGHLHTEPLLQSVFVLGVNSKAENESDEDVSKRGKQRPSVTFMVTPEQAEQMAFGDEMGDISLALRNIQDVAFDEHLRAVDVDVVLRHLRRPVAPVERIEEPRERVARADPSAPRTVEVQQQAAPSNSGPTVQMIRGGTSYDVHVETLDASGLKGSDAKKGGGK